MMNLGARLNNWLNVKWSARNNWIGQTGKEKGFCQFDTVEHGLRAAAIILKGYIKKGYDTPEKIITRFAPSEDHNDTERYIALVCAWTLYKGDQVLTIEQIPFLMWAMARMETGNILSKEQMEQIKKVLG